LQVGSSGLATGVADDAQCRGADTAWSRGRRSHRRLVLSARTTADGEAVLSFSLRRLWASAALSPASGGPQGSLLSLRPGGEPPRDRGCNRLSRLRNRSRRDGLARDNPGQPVVLWVGCPLQDLGGGRLSDEPPPTGGIPHRNCGPRSCSRPVGNSASWWRP